MDRRLRALELDVLRGPGDAAARRRLRGALARLACFEDRARWNEADPASQDLVLDAIGRLLGPGFAFEGGQRFAVGGLAHRVGTYRHVATGMRLRLLPGGEFEMGSERGHEREQPPRRVRVEPFLLGALPVLQAEWDRLPEFGQDERSWQGPDLPIEGITWDAARAWLAAAGDGLRLPAEAEWEYACRAGSRTEYFWGDAMDPAYCWFGDTDAWRTHPPAEHAAAANAFGLVDMSGNVAEWCEDAYVAGYLGAPADARPRASAWTTLRIIRGGDGFSRAHECRSAYRGMTRKTDKGAGIGLRAALSFPL